MSHVWLMSYIYLVSYVLYLYWSCKLSDWKASTKNLHHTFPPTKKRSENQRLDRLELRLAGKSVLERACGI